MKTINLTEEQNAKLKQSQRHIQAYRLSISDLSLRAEEAEVMLWQEIFELFPSLKDKKLKYDSQRATISEVELPNKQSISKSKK
jgi:hypothetical protein